VWRQSETNLDEGRELTKRCQKNRLETKRYVCDEISGKTPFLYRGPPDFGHKHLGETCDSAHTRECEQTRPPASWAIPRALRFHLEGFA
jgi:hypothetical protein